MNPNADPNSNNPGKSVAYDPSNPFNVGVSGTGDFTGGRIPAISSDNLAPTAPLNYSTPTPTPIPSVDYQTPPLAPTAPEQKATDLSTQLENLNNEMVGKSASQTAAETAAGIPALTTQQNDLSAQLASLANEAKAIPQQLQLDATGRGITAGGLAPIQAGRLRTNAIAALGVSSLLDATKGLLASAQTKADKAVAAKYDPIQEQITAATNNLNLILKSPDYSLADKNRAQAQLDVQKQKQDALDKAKQDTKDVNAVALEAAKNGADAVTLKNIMGAKDQASAIAAAGSTLKPADTTSVVDAGGRKLLIDSKTGATIKDLGSSATTSDIKAQKVQEDYKKAGQFLTDNPNASDAEIRNALLQNTSLTATDITALMATRYQAVNATTLADTDLQAIATGLIQQTSPEEALAAITAGRLNINGKEIVLSDEQKQKLTDEVNKQGNSPSSQKPWWQFW